MKKLNVILFKNNSEKEKFSNAICEKLSREKLSAEQEFCGIWGEIEFGRDNLDGKNADFPASGRSGQFG